MYFLDKKEGNTGVYGRYFWRIENTDGKGAIKKCFDWYLDNQFTDFRRSYYELIQTDPEMACPCTFWQAFFDRGRFSWSWWYSWPELCFESRRSKFIYRYFPYRRLRQECCYSTQWEDWGSLKIGPPDGGHVKVSTFYYYYYWKTFLTDEEAYKACCVDLPFCGLFYLYRPSDNCARYRPPPRRKFYCQGIAVCCHVMKHNVQASYGCQFIPSCTFFIASFILDSIHIAPKLMNLVWALQPLQV